MAPQSKKKKPVSKKNSVKKTLKKKRTRRKPKRTSHTKRNVFIVLALFLMGSLIAFGYFLGQGEKERNPVVKTNKVMPSTRKVSPKTVTKHSDKKPVQKKTKQRTKFTSLSSTEKPKLIIIIDDVHTRAQLSAIQVLKMKVTPSIFPPYKLSPNSHKLAKGLRHYMIHLPMESGNKQFNKQYKTLKVSFSNKKIENRMKELRILFPKAKYINNHTGSVFTSNYRAMDLAYKSMKKHGFTFIDSRTVNSTKVREIAYSYGDAYVARDIFIDNKHSRPYIHKQLKKAVGIAKEKGYAIAIGHPHSITMKALSTAKDILAEVELMYIDELYRSSISEKYDNMTDF